MNNFILTNILIIFFINYILCSILPISGGLTGKSKNSIDDINLTKWKCIFDSMCNSGKSLTMGVFTCVDYCDAISPLEFIKPPSEICRGTIFNALISPSKGKSSEEVRNIMQKEICTKENIKTEWSNCIMNMTETFGNKIKPGCNSESSMKNIQYDKTDCFVACLGDFFKNTCSKSSGLNSLYTKILAAARKRSLPMIDKLGLGNILGKDQNNIPKLGKC